MIDKFCEYLTNKIKKRTPNMDDEQAEIIMYGIQLIVGEIPKIFLMFIVGFLLGLWWQTLLAFLILLPYKTVSGGFHLKTHLGCFLCSNIIYCGNAIISTVFMFPSDLIRYIVICAVYMFGIVMVSIYAPADTENLPILTRRERKTKKILSYIFLTINMIGAILIPNTVIQNLIIFGTLAQTMCITKIAYIITKNKSGYDLYMKQQQTA